MSKALSIRQPWLFMILQKYKDIEVRTWNLEYRGELYLHASKTFDKDGYEHLLNLGIQMPLKDHFQLGKILGKANLTNVIKFVDYNEFYNYRNRHLNNPSWWDGTQHGFILQDIQSVVKPIEMKGQLNLFNVELDLELVS